MSDQRKRWTDAARVYRDQTGRDPAAAVEEYTEMLGVMVQIQEREAGVFVAIRAFDEFLSSAEGRAALSLLYASGQRIDICARGYGSQYVDRFFFDGTGLKRSRCSVVSRDEVVTEWVSARQVVGAWIEVPFAEHRPEDLLPRLREMLDQVAAGAAEFDAIEAPH